MTLPGGGAGNMSSSVQAAAATPSMRLLQHPLFGIGQQAQKHDLDLHDAAACITESNEGEADVIRAVIADEELYQEQARRSPAAVADEQMQLTASGAHDKQLLGLTTSHMETLKLLLSGGVAGAFSKSCTAPLARLTILYQVNGLQVVAGSLSPGVSAAAVAAPARLGVWAALRHVVAQEGLRALWKGNGVTIIHRLPYSAANFWTYEQVNELWKQYLPPAAASASEPDAVATPSGLSDITRRLVSGGVAGMTACALAYPLDLVRTRLAAQTSERYYHGIGHALATIVRDEGGTGLYRGLGATLLQVAPSLAINYAAYETLRSQWLSRTDLATPTVAMSLGCGSLAGLISSTATFPLDLVRRRMQLVGQGGSAAATTAQLGSGGGSYRGVFRGILVKEGVRGLYAGILPEYLKVVPGVAIAFCVYEMMKTGLGVQTNATQR